MNSMWEWTRLSLGILRYSTSASAFLFSERRRKALQVSGAKESEVTRVMAEVDLPNMSETTESRATLHTIKAFWNRFFSLWLQDMSLNRYHVNSRRIQMALQRIKLPRTKPKRKSSSILLEILGVVLVAFDSLDPLGPCNSDINFSFEKV